VGNAGIRHDGLEPRDQTQYNCKRIDTKSWVRAPAQSTVASRAIKRRETLMFYKILQKIMSISSVDGVNHVSVREDVFFGLLASAIRGKGMFDEKFYLENYHDIRDAVKSGAIASGLEHYITTGYFESRMPRRFVVDEAFYLRENPDVAEAIQSGKIKSAQIHFNALGFFEGRSPYKGFSLF
jgi:hypothetical protein